MKIILIFLFFSQFAVAEEIFTLEREIQIKTCSTDGSCSEFLPQEETNPNVKIALKKSFAKNINGGLDGWDRHKITQNKIAFKSEIHLIQYKDETLSLYAMLRSGPGTKRNGKVQKLNLKNASELKEIIIQDESIPFAKGTLQARLVIRPAKTSQ